MIVRELLAVFGMQYDATGQQQAEKGIAALQQGAQKLQMVFSQALQIGLIASPFVALTKMASDANENLNLLQLAFGQNADQVVEWSNKISPALGRSKYTMRELAAELGGLLQPMVGTNDTLAEMSTNLAQLAVDLSSARNISEKEARISLQSAMAGETQAIKRFGANLMVTRIQADAVAKGWSKNTNELSQAQLATLRYEAIMKDLSFIQGDAANTLGGFANSSRATRDALKDIGTEIGFFLLPAVEKALSSFRGFLKPVASTAASFREWAANTNLAKGALAGIAIIIAAMLIPMLLSVAPLLIAFSAFALILDEFFTTLEGGDSVMKRFTDALDGLEKHGFPGLSGQVAFVLRLFNRFRDVLGATGFAVYSFFKAVGSGDWSAFKTAMRSTAEELGIFEKGALPEATYVKKSAAKAAPSFNMSLVDRALGFGKALVTYGDTIQPRAMSVSGRDLNVARPESKAVAARFGDRSYSFNVTQQAGESSEDFARRVSEMIDKANEDSDRALYHELVQGVP